MRPRRSTRIRTAPAGSSASACPIRPRSVRCSTSARTRSFWPSSERRLDGAHRGAEAPAWPAPGAGRVSHPYLALTDDDREQMLKTIGVSSVEELVRDIPAGVRFDGALA